MFKPFLICISQSFNKFPRTAEKECFHFNRLISNESSHHTENVSLIWLFNTFIQGMFFGTMELTDQKTCAKGLCCSVSFVKVPSFSMA